MAEHKRICKNCSEERLVSRSMVFMISTGRSKGLCRSCGLLGNQRRLGTRHNSLTRKKMSASSLGKKKTEEHRKNISVAKTGTKVEAISGSKHYNWKGKMSNHDIVHRMRGTTEWKTWRVAVFTRDNFSCIDCGAHGVYLEPHHIIPLKQTLSRAFDITNGITLCRPCHKKTMGKELQLTRTYFSLIPAQV